MRQGDGGAGLGGVAQAGVEFLLKPGGADHLGAVDAFGTEGGAAQDMAGEVAVGIEAHFARAEIEAGVADFMDLLHLFGRQDLAHPQEAAAIGEAALQRLGVHFGEDCGQFGGGMDRIDHVMRLGIERIGQHVGGQDPALTVENVGALGGDFGAADRGAGLDGFGRRQRAHPGADHGKGHEEAKAQHEQTPFGAGAGLVAHLLVADGEVFLFDHIGVFTLGAGVEDAGEGAERVRIMGTAPVYRCRGSRWG